MSDQVVRPAWSGSKCLSSEAGAGRPANYCLEDPSSIIALELNSWPHHRRGSHWPEPQDLGCSRAALERLAVIFVVSTRPPSLNNHRGPGERAAALAASWCSRRVGSAYGRSAWQLLADAARLGLVRHGRPEAWAAGAVIAVARVNGLLGAGGAITAQQVADELDVTLGALAVTEQQLARALNVSSYTSPRPLP